MAEPAIIWQQVLIAALAPVPSVLVARVIGKKLTSIEIKVNGRVEELQGRIAELEGKT